MTEDRRYWWFDASRPDVPRDDVSHSDVLPPAVHTEGTMFHCEDTSVRPNLVPVPDRLGRFEFSAPWHTQGIRLTHANAELEPVGYSYWRNINAHRGYETLFVLLCFYRSRGGWGPTIFEVDKYDGTVLTPAGRPLFSEHSPYSWATAEGWFWSAMHPHVIYFPWGHQLLKLDVSQPQAGGPEVVFEVEENQYLWQVHTSWAETVFSATLKHKQTDEVIGALLVDVQSGRRQLVPRVGDFDECHIDKDGRVLLIKENVDGEFGEDNRIIQAFTDHERLIKDQLGAAGHSDMGRGYIVGENNFAPQPHAMCKWDLNSLDRSLMYHGAAAGPENGWGSGLGHVSHTNIHGDFVLVSNATPHMEHPRGNELITVPLNGSLTFRPIAPNLCVVHDVNDYRNKPKANLCPYGEYAVWTANLGGDALSAFMVKL